MKVVMFKWDTSQGEEYNQSDTMVVRLNEGLPRWEGCIEGIGLVYSRTDPCKPGRLQNLSCHESNVVGDVKEVTREEARKFLTEDLDKSLDIIFSTDE